MKKVNPGRFSPALIALLAVFSTSDTLVFADDMSRADLSSASLGRLFLTPAERSRVDSMRARGVTEEDIEVVAVTAPRKVIERVVVNGLVRRSNGSDAVWVNGKKLDSQRPTADNVVLLRGPDNQQRVVVGRTNGGQAQLKPGQSWDVNSGAIDECNDCNGSTVTPGKPNDAVSDDDDPVEENLTNESAGSE